MKIIDNEYEEMKIYVDNLIDEPPFWDKKVSRSEDLKMVFYIYDKRQRTEWFDLRYPEWLLDKYVVYIRKMMSVAALGHPHSSELLQIFNSEEILKGIKNKLTVEDTINNFGEIPESRKLENFFKIPGIYPIYRTMNRHRNVIRPFEEDTDELD